MVAEQLFQYCKGKMVENVEAEQLFEYSKSYCNLHLTQIGRIAIEVVAIFVCNIPKKLKEHKLTVSLFIDLKKMFDYMLKEQILIRITI